MAKEILLYNYISTEVATQFINELEAAGGEAICVRGNCPGGGVYDAIGMIQKFREYEGEKEIRVDGCAASAFAYMLLFSSKVKCLSVTDIMFHRAALWYEGIAELAQEGIDMLLRINKTLRDALEAKVPHSLWLSVTGVSYDRLFDVTQPQLDVFLTAAEAMQLGIVSEVIEFSPEIKKEIVSLCNTHKVAAFMQNKKPLVNVTNTQPLAKVEEKQSVNKKT